MKDKILTLLIISLFTSLSFADNENYDRQDVSGQTFSNKSLNNSSWIGATAIGTDYSSSKLTSANFTNANLTEARFFDATLTSADFTNAIVKGTCFSGLTKEQLYSTSSYKNKDLSGIGFSMADDLSGWNFTGQNLTNSYLSNIYLTGADFSNALINNGNFCASSGLSSVNFTNAIISGSNFTVTTFTKEQLYSTKSYKDKDLSGCRFDGNDMTNWDFSGQNLTKSSFSNSTLTSINFTDAIIKGASLEASTLTKEQLYSTKSYKDKDLSGCIFFSNDLSGWDFSGQNLSSTHFGSATLTDANFSNADLRGASMYETTGIYITKNTIMTDGKIQNFSMTSSADNLIIRKHTISAKFVETDKISNGATVTLKEGALAEINDNATITFASDSSLIIETSINNDTLFEVNSGSLVFEEGAKFIVNILGEFSNFVETFELKLIQWNESITLAGMEDILNNADIVVQINGKEIFNWDMKAQNNSIVLTIVPEPSAYAMIFGAIALVFAVYPRRK